MLYNFDQYIQKPYGIKPNTTKIFFSNLLTVLFIALSIVGVIFILHMFIGIKTLLTPFEVFNIELDTTKIVYRFVYVVFS